MTPSGCWKEHCGERCVFHHDTGLRTKATDYNDPADNGGKVKQKGDRGCVACVASAQTRERSVVVQPLAF